MLYVSVEYEYEMMNESLYYRIWTAIIDMA